MNTNIIIMTICVLHEFHFDNRIEYIINVEDILNEEFEQYYYYYYPLLFYFQFRDLNTLRS